LRDTVFYQGYGRHRKNYDKLLSETAAINIILSQLQAFIGDGTIATEKSALKSLAESGGIDSCFDFLRSVQRSITRCEQVKGQEVWNVGKMMLRPFNENEATDTLMKLSLPRENLHTALSVDTLYATCLTRVLFKPQRLS
jgi:hypothetical protein